MTVELLVTGLGVEDLRWRVDTGTQRIRHFPGLESEDTDRDKFSVNE
jgi:hypothetical protein